MEAGSSGREFDFLTLNLRDDAREKNAIDTVLPLKTTRFYSSVFSGRGELFRSGVSFGKRLFFRRRAFITQIKNAHRVFFNQIGNLLINRGIIVHLFFQGLVLGADIPEERGGIAQKFGGKVGVSGHFG
jgi:hypothetical protein